MRKLAILLPIVAIFSFFATDASALGRRNTLSAPQETEKSAQDTVKLDTSIARERVEEYLAELQTGHPDTILAKVNKLILSGEDERTQSFLAYTA